MNSQGPHVMLGEEKMYDGMSSGCSGTQKEESFLCPYKGRQTSLEKLN